MFVKGCLEMCEKLAKKINKMFNEVFEKRKKLKDQ